MRFQGEKVLCCVTDNASNMVKLVTTMNEDLKAAFGDQQDEDEDKDEYEDVEEDVDEETFDLQKAIPPSIEHMRCAAHTLQLAVIFIFDTQCSFFHLLFSISISISLAAGMFVVSSLVKTDPKKLFNSSVMP
jgi:hypothetical protein